MSQSQGPGSSWGQRGQRGQRGQGRVIFGLTFAYSGPARIWRGVRCRLGVRPHAPHSKLARCINMNLHIGAKRPVNGDQVFLVGRFLTSTEPPFVLLFDTAKRMRVKRNIQKIDTMKVVTNLGPEKFIELEYPQWGKFWFRTSKIRGVRALSADEMLNSSEKLGSLVLFEYDPEPEDEHVASCFSVWRSIKSYIYSIVMPRVRNDP